MTPRTSARIPLGCVALALVAVAACQNAGKFRVHFAWAEGAEPPADQQPLYAWGRVEKWPDQRGENLTVVSRGRTPVATDGVEALAFSGVPYETERVLRVVVDVRVTNSETDPIVYFGMSDFFSLQPDDDKTVDVVLEVQPTPAFGGSGAPADPSVVFVDSGRVVTRIGSLFATLRIHVAAGELVTVANDPSLFALADPGSGIATRRVSELTPVTGSEGWYDWTDWGLNGGISAAASGQDGLRSVFVTVANPQGYESSIVRANVTLDTTPPQVAFATLVRTPTFLPAIDQTTGVVRFSPTDPFTDEPVTATLIIYPDELLDSTEPTLVVHGEQRGGEITFGQALRTETSIQFEYTFPATDRPVEDTYVFSVTWADDLGKQGTRTVTDASGERVVMVVDSSPPGSADLDLAGVSYRRTPWGVDETGGAPQFSVRGQAGAANASVVSRVIAYLQPTSDPANQIGVASVGADGSFAVERLVGGDSPRIYVSPVDDAGVRRDPPVLVRSVEWVAALGNGVSNPHSFQTGGQHPRAPDLGYAPSTSVGALARRGELQSPSVATMPSPVTSRTSSSLTPAARMRHSMAYDSVRGRIVMAGGVTGWRPLETPFNEIWEWDGDKWSLVGGDGTRVVGVDPNNASSAAFDSARGETLFIGALNTFQSWDGVGAQRVSDDRIYGLSVYAVVALAYDSRRRRAVVTGGAVLAGSYQSCNWTYEWNGNMLVRRGTVETDPASVCPTALDTFSRRFYHAVAYDSDRQRLVLFGGVSGGSPSDLTASVDLGDTWEWDGEQWARACDGTAACQGPEPRHGHAMVYDSWRKRVVLVGGKSVANSYFDDVWEWDGTAWTGVCTLASPCVGPRPSPRGFHAMAFDSSRGTALLMGGELSPTVPDNELWTWDGSGWSFVCGGTTPCQQPSGLEPLAAAYDPIRARTLVHGLTGMESQTWSWNGAAWTLLCAGVSGCTSPYDRGSRYMVYDSVDDRFIMWVAQGAASETWVWNGASWDRACGTGCAAPANRWESSLAYDEHRNRVVLFGGRAGTDYLNDVWEWGPWGSPTCSPSSSPCWQQVSAAGDPPEPRTLNALAYDPVHRVTMMQGGRVFPTGAIFCDSRTWDGVGWTTLSDGSPDCGAADSSPTPMASSHQMVWDERRGKMLLVGSAISDGVWEWSGSGWVKTCGGSTGCSMPGARYGAAAAYDAERQVVVMVGGQNSLRSLTDVWEFDPAHGAAPAQVFVVDFASIDDAAVDPWHCVEPDWTCPIRSVQVRWYAGGQHYVGGTQTPGVQLEAWDWGLQRWRAVRQGADPVQNAAATEEPGLLSWSTDDPQTLAHLFQGARRVLRFAVSPLAGGDFYPAAAIASDYVDVVVSYELESP